MGTETPLTAGLCDRPDVLVHVLRNLTRRDAAALAASAAALRGAVRLCESSGGALQYQPRLFVACSGTSKLVEIPLDTSGPVAPPVTAQCLRRPPRKGSGALAGAQRRSAPSWPTSLAFSPWTRQLHVCQYSVHGVMTLAAPPAPPRQRGGRGGRGPAAVRPQQPARRVLIGRRAIEGPEGLAFADNGFLYVATINGSLAQIDPQKGTLLSTSPLPRAHFGDVPWPWPLVPWGMAAWPAPAAAPRAGAGAGEEQEAPASLLPAAGPGQEAPPAQLLVACELDYGTDSYTDSPPADSTDGCIMCAELAADGCVSSWKRFTAPAVKLPRPSGVCLGARGETLFVTTMGGAGAVVELAGPGRPNAGSELRRFSTAALHPGCPGAKPWDVCFIPRERRPSGGGREDLLAVSLHAGKRGGPGAVALLRARDGSLARLVTGQLLNGEPNMMALQQ